MNGKIAPQPGIAPDDNGKFEHHLYWDAHHQATTDWPAGHRMFYVCEWDN